jgi:hypothetical protein
MFAVGFHVAVEFGGAGAGAVAENASVALQRRQAMPVVAIRTNRPARTREC